MPFAAQWDFRVLDRFTSPVQKMGKQLKKLNDRIKNTSYSAKKLGGNLKKAGKNMQSFGAAASGAAAAMGIKNMVSQFTAFEDSLFDVMRSTDMSKAEADKYGKALEKMGMRLGVNSVGLADISYQLGKLGVANHNLEETTYLVQNMASAFDIGAKEAGESFGSIVAKMKFSTQQTQVLTDTINHLDNTTAASGKRMITIMQRVSGTFSQLQMDPKQAAAFSAFADQIEVTPELASSGLNMFFNRLSRVPGMSKKLLEKPIETVMGVLKDLGKMPLEKRFAVIRKMFGEEAGRSVKKMVSNYTLLAKSQDLAFGKEATGSMEREMQNRLARTSTKFAQAMEMFRVSFRAFGKALAPSLLALGGFITPISLGLANFAEAYPTLTKVGGAIAITGTAALLATVPIGMMVSGFGTIVTAFPFLTTGLAAVTKGFAILGSTILLNPVTWIIAAIAAVVGIIYRLITAWDDLKKSFTEGGFAKSMMTFFGVENQAMLDRASYNTAAAPGMTMTQGTQAAEKRASLFEYINPQASVDLSGEIRVAAEPGSKVTKADLPTGGNAPFAMGSSMKF
ncbi:MAG: phage tail tape measure protein [Gammaproteobacteria bacterium]|nr:phage tail tape measure protein [Gammaproteobacteria bacterium]